jgi:hypothetical protein
MFIEFSETWQHELFGKGKSIALIGNGPELLEKKYGHLIDSFDVVCRMNRFQTKGFEEFAGSKTNLYVTNMLFNPSPYLGEIQNVFVSRPFSTKYAFNVGLGKMMENMSSLKSKSFCFLSEQDYEDLLVLLGIPENDSTGRNPTTGIVTFYVLLRYISCERIALFGFDFFESLGNGGSAYYFNRNLYDGVTREAQYYYSDPASEKALFKSLILQAPFPILLTWSEAQRLGMHNAGFIIENMYSI